jgi:hypothetical protein
MCWFDEENCRLGIDALMNYQKRYNEKSGSYSEKPLHNWASHAADAFRYLSTSVNQILDADMGRVPKVIKAFK